jgi:hypothetical protein
MVLRDVWILLAFLDILSSPKKLDTSRTQWQLFWRRFL